MPKVPMYRQDGSTAGEIELADQVFGVEFRPHLVSQVVVAQRANQRQDNRMTKTRGMVSGGGAKPWRQKGTGRARQGSTRAPHWMGGGHAWGGQTHNSHQAVPPKMKRGALRSTLSEKCRNENVRVLEKLEISEIKTKTMAGVLKALGLDRGVVLVHEGLNPEALLSARNIPGLKMVRSQDLCTLTAAEAKELVITKDAVDSLVKRLSV